MPPTSVLLTGAIHPSIQHTVLSYCSAAEMDAVLEEVRAKYRALPKEAQDDVILRDFERMWELFRSEVEKRASRR